MDDWETTDWDAAEPLSLPARNSQEEGGISKETVSSSLGDGTSKNDDDTDWFSDQPKSEAVVENDTIIEGEPMIIVDLTLLSKGTIHSKFDRNSVNDPEGARELRLKIEANYEEYARNVELTMNKTVIPAATNVWRDALVVLRNENEGHYFSPIFPPKPK